MQILKGHRYDKPVRSLAFAPDGSRLASSARDYKTFVWDLTSGQHRVVDDWDSYTVAWAPDGRSLATGRSYGLSLWSADTDDLRVIDIPSEGGHGIHVAFSPDGGLLATVSGSVRFWDPATLEPLEIGPGYAHATNCLAFSRDGTTLATGHEERSRLQAMLKREVRLWDVARRQVRGALHGPSGTIDALDFSPDGRFLAAAAGRTLWIWGTATGEALVQHIIDEQHFKDVAFSPDGRYLALARNDATVRFWEVPGWREVAAFDWRIGPMISLAFAPDGMRAAAGSGKGKIVLWDVDL
jgi:WD40 repeat protein